ncbi:ribonuclease E inhibitor RraB [Rhodopirellula sp. P2]|uniref:ribonuclease E inhibitor RraB n=1 Tax=Rhodopirellula sp. P2 TaxID=2127060 RepID=UPI002368976C|nr:ribonuclease E inhibitor RraB [Rhodopirellula sp. P2]WDQ15121.1 ribonuclease E inhibitor RraB [Rhodopirellula sp. P2]
MLRWLRHKIASLDETANADWEIEPYLTNNVKTLLEIAHQEGDTLKYPRVVRHLLTFPDRGLAFSFRDSVPRDWATTVSKRDDGDEWQCACEREWAPSFADLVLDTHRLWTLALAVHPTLWAYTGMHHETGDYFWYVAPPLLEYD